MVLISSNLKRLNFFYLSFLMDCLYFCTKNVYFYQIQGDHDRPQNIYQKNICHIGSMRFNAHEIACSKR